MQKKIIYVELYIRGGKKRKEKASKKRTKKHKWYI